MPHLDLDGASLYYETHGRVSDQALLLIHAGIASLRMWDPIVAELERDHFVIRYDARGFGATSAQNSSFSERDDARALLDHLGIDTAVIIGCSRGGGIAIDLAIDSPHRVAGLVAVGAWPSGLPEVELTAEEDALVDRVDEAFVSKDWPSRADREVELWAFGPLRDPAELDPTFVQTAYELNRANIPHSAERPRPLPLSPPAADRLVDIEVPTLVAVGAHDLSETLVASEFIATAIPHADTARFTDSAHLPSVEEPERFAAVLLEWLRRNGL